MKIKLNSIQINKNYAQYNINMENYINNPPKILSSNLYLNLV